MKRMLCLLLLAGMCVTLCACDKETEKGSKVDKDSLSASSEKNSGVDVDLSVLNSTMVYSEIYNMLCIDPDSYIGKTVKITGQFSAYEPLDANGNPIPNASVTVACIVMDATACCAQGIEFVPEGSKIYPDDYPENGVEIMVIGELQPYDMPDGSIWYHLVHAKWQEN